MWNKQVWDGISTELIGRGASKMIPFSVSVCKCCLMCLFPVFTFFNFRICAVFLQLTHLDLRKHIGKWLCHKFRPEYCLTLYSCIKKYRPVVNCPRETIKVVIALPRELRWHLPAGGYASDLRVEFGSLLKVFFQLKLFLNGNNIVVI